MLDVAKLCGDTFTVANFISVASLLLIETDTSDARMTTVKALQQHMEPIPDDPQDSLIQAIFTKIRKMDANLVLIQNSTCSEVAIQYSYSYTKSTPRG